MKFKLLLFFIIFSIIAQAQNFENIQRYRANFSLANNNELKLIGIRSFTNNNQKYLLLINPTTLDTKVDLASNYKQSSLDYANVLAIFKNSTYVKALELSAQNKNQLQNAGLNEAIPNQKGITLTIDLCPSHKELDRVVFQSIFDEFKKIIQPAPLAISVSGKWVLKHEEDLNWLKSFVSKNELNITWTNHSYNHEVNALPLNENFLLAKNTNINAEVLENEQLMLKNGIVPSVFFRFPGLVSSKNIFDIVNRYGLIPLGSDAWLAKDQKPTDGSIVLIHANGNEENGVNDFLKLLKAKQQAVSAKQWGLFDLKQSLQQEFK